MAFIKKIQGLGSKGADVYYDNTIATPNQMVFDGSTYCTVSNYVPLEINVPRTFLSLSKTNQANPIIFSTSNNGSDSKEERVGIGGGDGRARISFFGTTTSIFIQSATDTKTSSKQNLHLCTYNGNEQASGLDNYLNGKYGNTIVSNDVIPTIINAGITTAYIGAYRPPAFPSSNLIGNISILTIVNRILTYDEIMLFNADPFGFNNSLTPAECHLRVDFNGSIATPLAPTDTSSFGRTISVTGTTTYEAFS